MISFCRTKFLIALFEAFQILVVCRIMLTQRTTSEAVGLRIIIGVTWHQATSHDTQTTVPRKLESQHMMLWPRIQVGILRSSNQDLSESMS